MNGISMLTLLIIQNNELAYATAGGPAENKKYTGWIMLDEDRWAPVLNTEPIYNSLKEAKQAMKNLIK